MNTAKLLTDIRDESGDTDLFVPAGTLVNIVSDEGDCLIVETMDKKWSFSVEYEQVKLQSA